MNMPSWDGKPETLDAYTEEVELLVLGTGVDQRAFLGPRMVAALPKNSVQRKAAARLSKTPDDAAGIAHEKGPDNIVKCLKASLGSRPLPLAAEQVVTYFRSQGRLKGESMAHYGERELEAYEKALKSVQAIDVRVMELVPDVVRGMLLWEYSSPTGTEKSTIAANLGGN